MTTRFFVNADGDQLLVSRESTVSVVGSSKSDDLVGTPSDEVFRGDGGGDMLVGGLGDDTYAIHDARDVVVENAGEGVDTVLTSVSYVLPDNVENLILAKATVPSGVIGQNPIVANTSGEGNALNNILTGMAGSQTLDGGGGDDVLTGGVGADVFVMRPGGGRDVVTDFQAGSDEARLVGSGFSNFAQVQSAMVQQGSDVVLTYATGEQLVFRNQQVSGFSAVNFQLQLDTSGLTSSFADDMNSLSLYNGTSTNYRVGAGTWWTRFGSANALNSYTLAGNQEQEIYVSPGFVGSGATPPNINPFSVSNGVASIITAPTLPADLPDVFNMPFTSGLMTTRLSFAQTYGYFEIRAKLPVGDGLWPAFWMLPVQTTGAAEIDVFEQLGRDPSTIYQTAHTSQTGKRTYVTNAVQVNNTDQFHTYGMLWDHNYLVWYIDGVETSRQATASDMNSAMYMLMNVAVGGPWAGPTNATTPFPSSMGIDYVHVFKLDPTPPTAAADAYSVVENGVLTVSIANGLLANDTTPPSNSLTAAVVSAPLHGTVVVALDGSFTYTPNAGYSGADSFTYLATAGNAQTSSATVSLTIAPAGVNQAPVVAGVAVLTASNEDATRIITTAELLAMASDPDGDGLAVTGLAVSAGALVDNHNGTWTFQPVLNDDTQVSFTYQVSDGSIAVAASATMDLLPVNDPLVVATDSISGVSGSAIHVPVATLLANDTDVDGDVLSVVSVAMGANPHGTVQLLAGVVTYTPNAGFVGPDSFTYSVTDGHVATPVVGTVNVTVTASSPWPTSSYIYGTTGADLIDLSARTTAQLVNGQTGDDTIIGGSAGDSLNGDGGNDVITGGAGADSLTGGPGSDILTGGLGADRFVWSALGDFGPAGLEDVVQDFSRASGDKLVLNSIDANPLRGGDQAFSFLGTGAFTGKPGQLDYAVSGADVIVYGDINGDGVADFQFRVAAISSLQASDFVL